MFARRWGFVSERMLKMNLSSKTKAHLEDEMHFYPPAGDVQRPRCSRRLWWNGNIKLSVSLLFFFFLLPGAARASWFPSELLLNVRKVQLGVISPPQQEQGGCLWESMVNSRLHSSVFTKTQWLLTEVLKYCRNTQLHPEQQTPRFRDSSFSFTA